MFEFVLFGFLALFLVAVVYLLIRSHQNYDPLQPPRYISLHTFERVEGVLLVEAGVFATRYNKGLAPMSAKERWARRRVLGADFGYSGDEAVEFGYREAYPESSIQ